MRYAVTDAEAKEKLTERQHQQEMLRTDVGANMKTIRVKSDTALSKNEAAIERLRAGIFIQMIGVVSFSVALLGGFIAILQFLK